MSLIFVLHVNFVSSGGCPLIEFEGKWCNNSVIVWGTHPDTDSEIGLSSLTENIGKTMIIISHVKEYRENLLRTCIAI